MEISGDGQIGGSHGPMMPERTAQQYYAMLTDQRRTFIWLARPAAPELVQQIFLDATRHRVGLTYEAEAEEKTSETIITGRRP